MDRLELKKRLFYLWSRIYSKYEKDLYNDCRKVKNFIFDEFINEFYKEITKIKITDCIKSRIGFLIGDLYFTIDFDGEITMDNRIEGDIIRSFYPSETSERATIDKPAEGEEYILLFINDDLVVSSELSEEYDLDLPKFSEWTHETLLMIKMAV